jgi:hypothetical protein
LGVNRRVDTLRQGREVVIGQADRSGRSPLTAYRETLPDQLTTTPLQFARYQSNSW